MTMGRVVLRPEMGFNLYTTMAKNVDIRIEVAARNQLLILSSSKVWKKNQKQSHAPFLLFKSPTEIIRPAYQIPGSMIEILELYAITAKMLESLSIAQLKQFLELKHQVYLKLLNSKVSDEYSKQHSEENNYYRHMALLMPGFYKNVLTVIDLKQQKMVAQNDQPASIKFHPILKERKISDLSQIIKRLATLEMCTRTKHNPFDLLLERDSIANQPAL